MVIIILLPLSLLLPLAGSVITSKRVMQVFGAKPEGGFWGVEVDVRREGRADPLEFSPLEGVTMEVAGVVYDPTSGYAALEGHEPHALYYAPVCSSGHGASGLNAQVITNITTFTQFTDSPSTNCVSCHATTFSIHGSDVYFLLTGDFGLAPDVSRKIQLRVLDPCERCQPRPGELWENARVFGTPFLFNCSHVVADIYTEIPDPMAEVTIKAGKRLKIVQETVGLSFFFQIFIGKRYNKNHDVRLNLYHVTPGSDVMLLRQEKVHSRYSQWDIQAMASVDYKEDVLCWSAADRLYCGYYSSMKGGRITGEKMLLFPGEGASSQVCTGETLDLLHIITGVAIGETGDKTSVFFGCYPKWSGLGGTGLIRLYRNWSKKRIFPLKVNGEPLIAGSLIVVTDAGSPCPINDYKPAVCAERPEEKALDDEPDLKGAHHTINDNEVPYEIVDESIPVPETNVTFGDTDVTSKERKSTADTIHYKVATTVILIMAFLFPDGVDQYV